jgi:uncharacterized protein YdaU (DUF1376 family)
MSDANDSDFDASSRPYMRLWINDIRGSTADWTCAQLGAHLRLLMAAWERGYVPTDAKPLRRICRDMDWSEMPEVLARWRKVILDTGEEVYINNRLERERERMMRDRKAKAANGRKGGEESAKQRSSKQSSKDEANDQANAEAKNQALLYSHTPILSDSQNPTDPDDQTHLHSHSSDMRSAQSKRRRKPDDPLSWNVDEGWVGITDADRADWAEAFPAVDIDAKLKGLTLWLKAWPKKAKKSRWRAWLLGRLRDEQDKGGSRAAGGGGGGFHRDKSHIPEDSHPDEEHLWFMTDGRTPRRIAIYKTKDGRLRYTSGEYAEDTTSQGDGNENDE